ncbi:MAG: UDP-N-acetylglucosamine pyrophosphorylase [Clostridia bacterium]|nr:UDP-N-acetylglucosamine pyrophosphorylase [Clostridia bacterium]
MQSLTVRALFADLSHTLASPLLEQCVYPWEVLDELAEFIRETGKNLPAEEYNCLGDGIYAAKSAVIAPSASVSGPCIIGAGAEIRHGAFIRGSALVGAGAVVGNSTELKNCILFDGVQVPHFNYVGDSVLGYKSHMGAGAVTSNVKSDKTPVTVACAGEKIETGRKKFGAALGDYVEVGCHCVLNPGTVIGKNTNIYPLSSVRGSIGADSIYKTGGIIVKKR